MPGLLKLLLKGKGRGRQVIAVSRTSDLILMVLDATKGGDQREILENELESMGIRLNKQRPNISIKVKKTGCENEFNYSTKYLDEKLLLHY